MIKKIEIVKTEINIYKTIYFYNLIKNNQIKVYRKKQSLLQKINKLKIISQEMILLKIVKRKAVNQIQNKLISQKTMHKTYYSSYQEIS